MAATHVLYDVDPVAITLCKKGANRQRFFLRKSDDTGDLLTLPASHRLLKAGSDWSAVYCVVAEPGAEENGGLGAEGVVDVWRDEEEIRKAAHRFSKNRAYVNAMHGAMAEQGCHVVENAVALTDFDVDGVTIRKGSWYLAIEPSPELRERIDSGEIEAVSIEGTGLREAVAKASYVGADKCPKCGSKVAKEATRCPNCGASSPKHVKKVKSSVYPSLERKPGKQNWVDRAGGLPKYIERIAKHLHYEKGMSISHAIAAAVNTVKRWAAGGKGVSPATQAKAQKALAEWERKKRSGVKKEYTVDDSKLSVWRQLGLALGVAKAEPDDDEEKLSDEELALLDDASLSEGGTLGGKDDDEEDTVDEKRLEAIEKSQQETTSALTALTDLVKDLTGKITERQKDDKDEKPTAESLKKSVEDLIDGQQTMIQGIAKVAADVDKLAAGDSGQHDDPERTRVEKKDEPWYAGVL